MAVALFGTPDRLIPFGNAPHAPCAWEIGLRVVARIPASIPIKILHHFMSMVGHLQTHVRLALFVYGPLYIFEAALLLLQSTVAPVIIACRLTGSQQLEESFLTGETATILCILWATETN